ncbi:MAG: ABC transporter ATP-binding protein, partial [Alphaproteobacteria bacterium]|nr:ABC transporter ATP-binding protein [Alphaproteobacteria bacterium]
MLQVQDLSLAHGDLKVVERLSLAFRNGELTALVGPNGAGKSTLLRALFGDHRAASGEILLDGERLSQTSLRAWQNAIGYMPQENRGRMGLSAMETVLLGSLGRLTLHVPEDELRRAAIALDQFGLAEVSHR